MGYSKKYRGNYTNFLKSTEIIGRQLPKQDNIEIISDNDCLQRAITERDLNYQFFNRTASVPVISANGIVDAVFTPPLDKFEFRDTSSDYQKHCFFIKLQRVLASHNKKSRLVDHFAFCEKNNLEYTDPECPSEKLLRRSSYHFCKNREDQQNYGTYYTVNGGHSAIERIMDLDINFCLYVSDFAALSKEAKGFNFLGMKFELTNWHVCQMGTEEIMPRMTKEVKKGHVYTSGSHLYGIGTKNNEVFKDRVGRQCAAYNSIKKDNTLDLATLYVGDKEKPVRYIIYSKSKEVFEKGQSVSDIKTHIEMRVNAVKANYDVSFYENLLTDYFGPAASYFRTIMFLEYLYKNLMVTKKQRVNSSDPTEYRASIAEWWLDSVISPLQQLCDLHISAIRKNLNRPKERSKCLTPNSHPLYHVINEKIEAGNQNPDEPYLTGWYSYYQIEQGKLSLVPPFFQLMQEQAMYCIEKITNSRALAYYKRLKEKWECCTPSECHPMFYFYDEEGYLNYVEAA